MASEKCHLLLQRSRKVSLQKTTQCSLFSARIPKQKLECRNLDGSLKKMDSG